MSAPQIASAFPASSGRPNWTLWAWAGALFLGVLPLWVGRHLPLVDLPQHLHLISVLHRLDDPTTLYPQVFDARGQLTPYLGYYYLVSLLNWLLPLHLANKVFLSLYVIGMPLGLAFLLRSLGRPTWPALLALPFAYGDSFAWGFINYCSALPLTFVAAGCFVRAITDSLHRVRWGVLLAASLAAVLLFHVQAFAFLGIALPFLLLTTRAPEDRGPAREGDGKFDRLLRPRMAALLGVLPGVALFVAWFGGRLGQPAEIAPGEPWKAWGPMFSEQNLAWKSREQNLREFPEVLANMVRDGSDRYVLYAVLAVACIGIGLSLASRPFQHEREQREGPIERWRILGLGLIALAMYFLLPFDIRGYVYYLNTRYAHLAAPLLLAAIPWVRPRFQQPLALVSAACALMLAFPLARAFSEFNREAAALDELASTAGPGARVMGLLYDPTSRITKHPVFIHSAAVLARERGGFANFSFALTPHSPLKYRGAPPPTFPSEWRPRDFSLQAHGPAYDHFLIRGADPSRTPLGPGLSSEFYVAGRAGSFVLVRRR